MGQKANPTSLRPRDNFYQGCAYWDEAQFNYITYAAHKLLKGCCRKTDIYLNNINIGLYHDFILLEAELLHLHSNAKRKRRSRRYKENSKSYIKKNTKKSWRTVLRRLFFSMSLLQNYTGLKKIKLKIRRIKAYSRSIPKRARQKTSFYTKGFNKAKFNYARSGMQLMSHVVQEKASVLSLASFIRENIRTRSRRKKHVHFLSFLKRGFESLKSHKKIKGLKIQIKGRFGHKPKGRSRIWKYQMGPMPFSQLEAPIQTKYVQAQTILGSVGIKVWIYHNSQDQC
uniref:ribosomal protein S3 n=1 Tax=Microzonia abyssicola TaxID=217214 RepID=UPI002E75AB91|nr:ribosomal protein S3 [Syringoderma abyssicola]WBP70371.1 ribosomal protein S3 [Syringoderma abyssicola]